MLPISTAFSVRIPRKKCGRLIAQRLNPVDYKVLGLKNNAAAIGERFVMSANWSRGCLSCAMGFSRHPLMKMSTNGANVCEPAFVLEADILSTWF